MKHAVITGGTSWIAQATAIKMERDGWSVYLSTRDDMDVTDSASVKAYINQFEQIDALINVAGGLNRNTERKSFLVTPPEDFEAEMQTNFYSVVNVCRSALPIMVNQGSGVIINIVSGAALTGFPRMAAYSSAKAAVLAFTRSLAQETGIHGIRANCVLPGFTTSRWYPEPKPNIKAPSPLGRPTSPEDVGEAIAFLASDGASHITGACLDLSGGVALH